MRRQQWSRRYPPLAGAVASALLAVFVLPSALNVPQSNPTQTLEFAPVPPEDDQPPPPDSGNMASLGLGTSTSTVGDAPGGGAGLPPPPPIPAGIGEAPLSKRCVGNPPRQTEDALSPPCVAHFEGDNGGATHRGVESDEIRILFYVDGHISVNTTSGNDDETDLAGRYFDLALPPTDEEQQSSSTMRIARRWQTYFNQRFQTYNRVAHFHVYFSTSDADDAKSSETRRADAIDNLAVVDPFAVVLSRAKSGFELDYMEVMASRGVLSFGARNAFDESFLQRFAGAIWSFRPSVEQHAERYISYLCSKVVPHPVVDSGNAETIGQPRRLGLLYTTDPGRPDLHLLTKLTREGVEACGGTFESQTTFPVAGRTYQTAREDAAALYATNNMAKFQQDRVTTIIWPGGYETDQSKAAARLGYEPEWILAGDYELEGNWNASYNEPETWEHAWIVTSVAYRGEPEEDPCRQAIEEADPAIGRDGGHACGITRFYEDLRQLFTGIQVAGPRLTVETIDQGFHAIPRVASTDPRVPACFYDPGDYTCVKDAVAEFWDAEEPNPNGVTVGCWRMVQDGRRYLTGQWPDGNIDAQATPQDLCNSYDNNAYIV
ncbi:MAG TPA: hypothetical protein VGA69_12255 [Nitriliruptorales bacterium]